MRAPEIESGIVTLCVDSAWFACRIAIAVSKRIGDCSHRASATSRQKHLWLKYHIALCSRARPLFALAIAAKTSLA